MKTALVTSLAGLGWLSTTTAAKADFIVTPIIVSLLTAAIPGITAAAASITAPCRLIGVAIEPRVLISRDAS